MKILVGTDERDTALSYQIILVNRGHHVKITETGDNCVRTYCKNLQVVRTNNSSNSFMPPFDVVILDYEMPDMNGLEVAKGILAANPHQRIIFTSVCFKEAVSSTMKELEMPVQILSKAMSNQVLVGAVEDTEIYDELKKFKIDVSRSRKSDEIREKIS
jgi:CheY-like chemotaxis protein